MNLNNFENVTHSAQGETVFLGGNFLFRISELTQRERIYVHFANYRFSFRKLQILISQTTDFHFANYRFPFRKVQISISQTTDSHFANYRFPFPFRFVPFRFANYSKPSSRYTDLADTSLCNLVKKLKASDLFKAAKARFPYNRSRRYCRRCRRKTCLDAKIFFERC